MTEKCVPAATPVGDPGDPGHPAPPAPAGRTSRLRFVLALAPLLLGASALLAGSAAGAVSVAFAGEVPVTVHAARVSGSGVSASPGVSGRGGISGPPL